MFLIYSPDGSNVRGARGGKFEGIGPVQRLKVVKSCSYRFTCSDTFAVGCIV